MENTKEINKTEEIKMEEHAVAFIDILGATAHIIKKTLDINIVKKVFQEVSAEFDKFSTGKNSCVEVKYKIFSDNIILYCNRNDEKVRRLRQGAEIFQICEFVKIVQRSFAQRNILTRGGITFDEIYLDDTFVWGKALVDAYLIESSVAVYPRVVIDDKIDRMVLKGLCDAHYAKRDNDGAVFVNFAGDNRCIIQVNANYSKEFRSQLKHYLDSVHEYDNMSIQQKHNWLSNYVEEVEKEVLELHKDKK